MPSFNHRLQLPRLLSPLQSTGGLIAAVALCSGLSVSLASAQDINAQGWTVLEPSVDTRFIFVSSSDGNDSNSGYSPSQAVRSLEHAKGLLRDGSADWMLLKRGDVWHEGIGTIEISGRSAEERLVFSSYGESDERPKMILSEGSGISGKFHGEVSHVAIVGIHFEAAEDNSAAGSGIGWLCSGENFLIEDCHVEGFRSNVLCTANDGHFSNFAMRRSVVVDAWNTTGHSQGLLVVHTDGVVIEENVIDHNGWNPDVADAEATMFNQNVYLQISTTGTEFHGNITARAAGAGVQMRRGGNASQNLVYANPIGMRYGYRSIAWPDEAASGSLIKNVVLGGELSDSELLGGGTGIWIERASDVKFEENVVAHLGEGTSNWAISIHDVGRDLQFDRNVVFDWGKAVRSSADLLGSNPFSNNHWQSYGDDYLLTFDDPTGVEFKENRMSGFSSGDELFKFDGSKLDYNEWAGQSYVDGDTLGTQQLSDMARNLDSYAVHLGYADAEEFLEAARGQSRANWDPKLTGRAASEWIGATYLSMD